MLVGVEQGDCCVGVRDTAVEIAVVPQPSSCGVCACGELLITRVLERVEDEPVAGVGFSFVPEAVAEVAQELGPQVAIHRRGVERFEHRARSSRLSCVEEVVGER